MACNHCANTIGFALGTCVECGWNNDSKRFNHIQMYIHDADRNKPIMQKLIGEHSERTKDLFKRKSYGNNGET